MAVRVWADTIEDRIGDGGAARQENINFITSSAVDAKISKALQDAAVKLNGSGPSNIERIMESIAGRITEDVLWTGLRERINLITDTDKVIGSVNARLKALSDSLVGPDGTFTEFVNGEYAATKDKLGVTQTLVNLMASGVATPTGDTVTSMYERALTIFNAFTRNPGDGVLSLVEQVESLATAVDFGPGVTATSYINGRNFATVSKLQEGLGLKAEASTVNTLATKVDTASAAITTMQNTITTNQTSTAASILQLQAQIGGDTDGISLEAKATVTAGKLGVLEGQYTVKIDANGFVGGYGLAVGPTTPGGQNTSRFYVNADTFAVGSNATGTNSAQVPFFVEGGKVYMYDAFIKSLAASKINVTGNIGTGLSILGVPVLAGVYSNNTYSELFGAICPAGFVGRSDMTRGAGVVGMGGPAGAGIVGIGNGTNTAPSSWAGFFVGSAYVSGSLVVDGAITGNFTVPPHTHSGYVAVNQTYTNVTINVPGVGNYTGCTVTVR